MDDKGNQTPLDNGDYVLTDGRTITVKDNSISNVSESESEEEGEDEKVEEEDSKQTVKMEDGVPDDQKSEASEQEPNDVAVRLEDLEKQIEDILAILKKLGSTQGEVNEQMMSKLKELSEENGAKPIKTIKKGSIESDSEDIKSYLKERFSNKKK